MANVTQPTQQQFSRLTDLTKRFGMSGSSFWGFVKNGTFPAPVKLSPNCTAWVTAEVDQWAADRITASRDVEAVSKKKITRKVKSLSRSSTSQAV